MRSGRCSAVLLLWLVFFADYQGKNAERTHTPTDLPMAAFATFTQEQAHLSRRPCTHGVSCCLARGATNCCGHSHSQIYYGNFLLFNSEMLKLISIPHWPHCTYVLQATALPSQPPQTFRQKGQERHSEERHPEERHPEGRGQLVPLGEAAPKKTMVPW